MWKIVFTVALFSVYIVFLVLYTLDMYRKRQVHLLLDYTVNMPTLDYVNTNDKLIWSYWGREGEYPLMVKLAIHSWKYTNPDYKIVMLSKNTLQPYLETTDLPDNFGRLNIFRQEDAVKLAVLQKYGGVWLSTNVLLTTSFTKDWLPVAYGLGGFYREDFTTNKDNPVLNPNFLIAPKNNPLIAAWKTETYNLLNGDITDNIQKLSIDFQNIRITEAMLLPCTLLKVRKDSTEVVRLKVCDLGIYDYLADTTVGVNMLSMDTADNKIPPVIILTNNLRQTLENNWYMLSDNSLIDRILRKQT